MSDPQDRRPLLDPHGLFVPRWARWGACGLLFVALLVIALGADIGRLGRAAMILIGALVLAGVNAVWRDFGGARDGA